MGNLTVIYIDKANGKLVGQSREVFKEAFDSLTDGNYKVVFDEQKRGYTPSRYKYYFAHVLETILLTCGNRFEVLDGENFRPVKNTQEIHEALKMKYNPVIVRTPFGAYAMPSSTTGLSDGEFIGQFEETIIAEFSQPPFGCDFLNREEWAAMMKDRHQPFPNQ